MTKYHCIVDDLYKKYKTTCPRKLCEKKGIKIYFNFLEGDKISIISNNKYNNQTYIFLSKNLHKKTEDRLIAHELSHYLLHPNCYNHDIEIRSEYLTTLLDFEANILAEEILKKHNNHIT